MDSDGRGSGRRREAAALPNARAPPTPPRRPPRLSAAIVPTARRRSRHGHSGPNAGRPLPATTHSTWRIRRRRGGRPSCHHDAASLPRVHDRVESYPLPASYFDAGPAGGVQRRRFGAPPLPHGAAPPGGGARCGPSSCRRCRQRRCHCRHLRRRRRRSLGHHRHLRRRTLSPPPLP